jgi:transcriptional regulator with XRE-family HTH domain
MADRIEEEAQRIRKLLTEELDKKRLSVRALERRLGLAVGTRRKVLNGAVGLSFRNILEILDAAEVDWGVFFRSAYAGGSDPDSGWRKLIREEVRSVLREEFGALREGEEKGKDGGS